MINFSEISLPETGRNHVIQNMVSSTGLKKERIEKLFESFSYANNGDLTKINESFTSFISPNSTFNFQNFRNQILDLAKQITEPSISLDQRSKITEMMFNAIQENCGVNVDVPGLLEIICFVLLLKNPKFEAVQDQIYFGKKTKDLFESYKLDFTPINVNKVNSQKVNQLNGNEDKRLYESLKDILAKNNKRWGNNYHLDNTYTAIVDYIDKEILEITNAENVYTVSDTFEMDLINMILKEKQLNPMYRSIDVLRTLIPDIQTLVFDMMLLINQYIVANQETIEFVNRNNYIDYVSASKNLFAGISTSLKSSKVSANSSLLSSAIMDNFAIDKSKVEIDNYPVQLHSAVDMVHIIKSCETEFSLHLRKVINNYFTKTMNLLASTEKVLIEVKKSNKFKNAI